MQLLNDFMTKLKEVTQFDFFTTNVLGEWKHRYSLPMSPILTKLGLCFNFNLEPAGSLLHLDKYKHPTLFSLIKNLMFLESPKTFITKQRF